MKAFSSKPLITLFILMLFSRNIQAQLCTGSLGDPVVNITFGNQTTQAGPLKFGVTNLAYTTDNCPGDGYYSITNTSPGCFGATWHNISSDHTGDPGGRVMLINASYTPNDFYVDTVKGLCGNTTYEFGAWVINVLKFTTCGANGIKPNLTFRIETVTGTVLNSYTTGAISESASALWQQFGFFFTPAIHTNTVVLRITNNAAGGCGNDLALDDITFRPCGPAIVTSLQNSTGNSMSVCEKSQLNYPMNATVGSGFADPDYQWQYNNGLGWTNITGANTIIYNRTPTGTGTFQYRLSVGEKTNAGNELCSVASTSTTIRVLAEPTTNPGVDTLLVCTGSDAVLTTPANAALLEYSWTGPNGFSSTLQNPGIYNAQLIQTGNYIVTQKTTEGCFSKDTSWLKVVSKPAASIQPSATILCAGDTILLTATGGETYRWSPLTGLSNGFSAITTAAPIQTTTYQVKVINNYGCADSTTVLLTVIENPVVNAGADKRIFEGSSIQLDGNITGSYNNYFWMPPGGLSNTNILQPIAAPVQTSSYILFAEALQNCGLVSDTMEVKVFTKVEIPNAFSPNGDGINDSWNISGLEFYPQSSLKIFNRYGQIVFQSKPYANGWNGTFNGTQLPIGSYYYIIDRGMGLDVLSGTILLIR